MCRRLNRLRKKTKERGRRLNSFRKLAVAGITATLILATLGIFASAFDLQVLATTAVFVVLICIVSLILSCTKLLLRTADKELKSRDEIQRFMELISKDLGRLDESLSKGVGEQFESRRLLKSQHEHLTNVRKVLVDLNHQVTRGKQALGSFNKEVKNGIREAERRVSQNAPKANEVKRIHERLQAAERRILGALETQRYTQHTSLSEQLTLISELNDRLQRVNAATEYKPVGDTENKSLESTELHSLVAKINRHVTSTVRDSTRQVESLVQLLPRFSETKLPMPSTGGFAIDSQALAHLVALVEEHRPRKILELGSGTSTIWLGYLCRSIGAQLVTLDHLGEYLTLTRSAVDRHHLTDRVDTRFAPLEEVEVDGDPYDWYSLGALDDLTDIDMVVVDGPPASTGSMARYPALPMILERLSDEVTVILDDAQREDEAETVQRWQAALPDFIRVEVGTSRLAVLRRCA